jgi:hypothetical protein
MYKSSIYVAVDPHFQGWIVTLPELIQRKLMAGMPGPFRNLNFGDFVGIRVAIVVPPLDHSYYITIPMVLWFLSRRFFDNSANHDALLTLSTIMIEFLFGIKITNLVEVHPMKIHVCYHLLPLHNICSHFSNSYLAHLVRRTI